jgi:hypothetical protein
MHIPKYNYGNFSYGLVAAPYNLTIKMIKPQAMKQTWHEHSYLILILKPQFILIELRVQNIYKKCKYIYLYERVEGPNVDCNLTFPTNVSLIGVINPCQLGFHMIESTLCS